MICHSNYFNSDMDIAAEIIALMSSTLPLLWTERNLTHKMFSYLFSGKTLLDSLERSLISNTCISCSEFIMQIRSCPFPFQRASVSSVPQLFDGLNREIIKNPNKPDIFLSVKLHEQIGSLRGSTVGCCYKPCSQVCLWQRVQVSWPFSSRFSFVVVVVKHQQRK